jgi:hypothetical protein
MAAAVETTLCGDRLLDGSHGNDRLLVGMS